MEPHNDTGFLFADDEDEDALAVPETPSHWWKVLVVDDEPEVHSVTSMVLSDIRYHDRGIRMLSAMSAEEAKGFLRAHADIACILLDVVMETDDAGLKLVRYVREELGNKRVRIILRTGQPGQAPEREIIVNYDINDYKAKTELTAQNLFTTIVATLRSYEDILALEMNRQGLRRIIDASASLFQVRSMQCFASGVLTQLSALLGIDVNGILCAQRGGNARASCQTEDLFILAASGIFEGCATKVACAARDCDIKDQIARALQEKRNVYGPDSVALYISSPNDREVIAYLQTGRPLSHMDEQLVEVFCGKVSVGFDNIHLYEQLRSAHAATVYALADLAEYKDTDTGEHVLRIEEMSERTARKLRQMGVYADQIDDTFLDQIGMASILHDVGKVSTPDHILQKPGRLTDEERAIMKEHAGVGGAILERAGRMVDGTSYLSLGAAIAAHHHERWDGNGYPKGLKGEDIPLAARIVAVVDVYDALASRRPYKEPWPLGKALAFIREGAGTQFDPGVVEAFLAMLAEDGVHPAKQS